MNANLFNNTNNKPRILIAPLDWGLGHATRCIPIINKLLILNCEVVIAAEGPIKKLLQQEYPHLLYLDLRGYRITYSRKKFWLPLKMLFQVPKIFFSIYKEQRWLKKAIRLHTIDVVLSDNRFGMYCSLVPCLYITHQLSIKTNYTFTSWLVQKFHYYFINKYKECWVPDFEEGFSLAGDLSHPKKLPTTPVKYLGPLSRFKKEETEAVYSIAIILSGPEPQRTIFENLIINDLKRFEENVILVRGIPEGGLSIEHSINSLTIHNHLPSAELGRVIQQADLIISRCGYSTVMDLIKLQKKAILVPTPGQTEQEYLANYLREQQNFYCVPQEEFSFAVDYKKAQSFNFTHQGWNNQSFDVIIENFVDGLNNN